mmetsp:Transcript_11942/g.19580  ORF Transcript_11942/g.19580 Transcript_11942/m.19580 type:complete len:147 (+) Transcript_11942:127-567(+)
MRFHRELLLILALSTTNTIASSTSSSGHLRGPSPSVELEASHEERQLAPGNGNGCDNGNGSSSNGQGPCKGTAATATTSSPTMAVVKPPLVCDEALVGQACTDEGSSCSEPIACPCSDSVFFECTCVGGTYQCLSGACLACEEPLV